jgi:RNA polymerase sigma-70 factor (ECF subfamily)
MDLAGRTQIDHYEIKADLFERAQSGCSVALGQVLEDFRPYLLLVAQEELDDSVKVKTAVSDVVQDTFVEAHRDFDQFAGRSPHEFRAWLRRILLNNIANTRRHFRNVKKRQTSREVPLDESSFKLTAAAIADSGPSPSRCAIASEEQQRLERVMAALSSDDQMVLDLRHRQLLTFREIGLRMNRTPDAARMLWWRAFERLAEKLESSNA